MVKYGYHINSTKLSSALCFWILFHVYQILLTHGSTFTHICVPGKTNIWKDVKFSSTLKVKLKLLLLMNIVSAKSTKTALGENLSKINIQMNGALKLPPMGSIQPCVLFNGTDTIQGDQKVEQNSVPAILTKRLDCH